MKTDALPSKFDARLARLPFFYGWVVVALAFVTMGIGVNVRSAFSLLYPPILAEFDWPRGVTAAAFSIGFVSSSLYSPAIGFLIDRLGPRLVIPIGTALVSTGLVLTTMVSQPWHLYLSLGVLVVGGSVSMAYTGHAAFLPNWFARRRGLAVGIAFSGVGVGAVVMFPWLQHLIDTTGWRSACFSLALLMLVVIVPINLLLQRARPEDLGVLADGDRAPTSDNAGRPVIDNIVDRAWTEVDWTLARALRTARFWLVFAGFVCGMYAWYAVLVHQTQFLIDVGFTREMAAQALGLVPLMGVAGQIGFGWLSDRIGREWGWTIGCLGFVLCYGLLIALQAQPSMPLLLAMVIAQGFLGFSLTPNFGSIPAEIFQGRHTGTIFGTVSTAAAVGAGLGPWLTGTLHDRTGDYSTGFWVALVMAALSCLFIWLAAPRHVRLVAGQAARRHALQAQATAPSH